MLLTNEARIESNQLSANEEAKLNYAANIAQAGPNNKKPSGQANRYQGTKMLIIWVIMEAKVDMAEVFLDKEEIIGTMVDAGIIE